MIPESLWMLRRWRYELSPRKVLRQWYKDTSAWLRFWQSYKRYCQLAHIENNSLINDLYPCLGDDTAETLIEPIYFYQDAWAFERIVQQRPQSHVDIGSHHKFVAFLSKVVPVTMVDIRPLSLPLDSLQFKEGSILNLPFEDSSVKSLSSLCVVEHIGLGRYGDPLDPQGSEKAITELKRVISPGGNLYISMPLDDSNKVYFNAHRAFTEEYLHRIFQPFKIVDSSYIYGSTFGKELKSGFGVGCYHLRRLE